MSDTQTILPQAIGIGLRSPHFQQVLEQHPDADWLEIHSENFFNPASAQRLILDQIAPQYPLSFHGIGLSLGSTDPLNSDHLKQLKALVDCYSPALISEHLSWSSVSGQYFNDLLPIPYTSESLLHFSDRVKQVQDYLGRNLLIENPTAYLSFDHSEFTEAEFLAELQHRSGCDLLLDLNNIYVNSINLGMNLSNYLETIPVAAVKEIHLAGFTRQQLDSGEILIDTHGSRVSDPVWSLFCAYRQRCQAPALIEWDTDIPALSVLMEEADKAREYQQMSSDWQRVSA
ncbi:MAG: DUF692 domain-containing protein [Motiliproteus sp.]